MQITRETAVLADLNLLRFNIAVLVNGNILRLNIYEEHFPHPATPGPRIGRKTLIIIRLFLCLKSVALNRGAVVNLGALKRS